MAQIANNTYLDSKMHTLASRNIGRNNYINQQDEIRMVNKTANNLLTSSMDKDSIANQAQLSFATQTRNDLMKKRRKLKSCVNSKRPTFRHTEVSSTNNISPSKIILNI